MTTMIEMTMLVSILSIVGNSSPIILTAVLLWSVFLVSCVSAVIEGSWLFFSINILYVGGVMVLLMYVVSLTANEKILLGIESVNNWNTSLILLGVVMGTFTLENPAEDLMTDIQTSFFMGGNWVGIILLTALLTMVLLVVIWLCEFFKGPLTKKF